MASMSDKPYIQHQNGINVINHACNCSLGSSRQLISKSLTQTFNIMILSSQNWEPQSKKPNRTVICIMIYKYPQLYMK